MAINTAQIRYQVSQAWLAFLGAIYQLPPAQRLIIVGGIILLLPIYWGVRWTTYGILTHSYAKQQLIPRPSFTESKPLEATQATLLTTRDASFTAYLNINNPNTDLAVDHGVIEVTALDVGGAAVHKTKLEISLLPGQKRLIVIPKFTPARQPVVAKIQFSEVHLQKRFEIPTLELEALTPELSLLQNDQQTNQSGTVINRSPYLLKKVEVVYTFFGLSGKIIGVAQRAEFDVRPEEKRDFPILSKDLPQQKIERIETSVFSNPLDATNVSGR